MKSCGKNLLKQERFNFFVIIEDGFVNIRLLSSNSQETRTSFHSILHSRKTDKGDLVRFSLYEGGKRPLDADSERDKIFRFNSFVTLGG